MKAQYHTPQTTATELKMTTSLLAGSPTPGSIGTGSYSGGSITIP